MAELNNNTYCRNLTFYKAGICGYLLKSMDLNITDTYNNRNVAGEFIQMWYDTSNEGKWTVKFNTAEL